MNYKFTIRLNKLLVLYVYLQNLFLSYIHDEIRTYNANKIIKFDVLRKYTKKEKKKKLEKKKGIVGWKIAEVWPVK